jgi:iron complex outermembrane receptor protein
LGGKEVNINTTSGFIRTDVKPIKNLRIIAAARADKFSVPDKTCLAYEFASTYSLTENHLIHAAITRSNSGSFIGTNYLNLAIPVGPGLNFVRQGQQNLNLLTVNLMEIGYRAQLRKELQVDIDFFQQKVSNLSAFVIQGPLLQQSQNVPTTATQLGATFSINFVPSEKLQFKPFITLQKTDTDNLLTAYAVGAPVTSGKHTNTPSFYGGYYLNYKVSSKINVNTNGYYFAAHRQYDVSDPTDTSQAGNISGKLLVNVKASYALTEKLNLFVNGRNVLNNDSREFFGADKIGGLYLVGASFNLN